MHVGEMSLRKTIELKSGQSNEGWQPGGGAAAQQEVRPQEVTVHEVCAGLSCRDLQAERASCRTRRSGNKDIAKSAEDVPATMRRSRTLPACVCLGLDVIAWVPLVCGPGVCVKVCVVLRLCDTKARRVQRPTAQALVKPVQ